MNRDRRCRKREDHREDEGTGTSALTREDQDAL